MKPEEAIIRREMNNKVERCNKAPVQPNHSLIVCFFQIYCYGSLDIQPTSLSQLKHSNTVQDLEPIH